MMDAKAKTVSGILNTASRYLIPFFQRQYSWKKKQWLRLWRDIIALLESEARGGQHFLGPLVCTPDKPGPDTVQTYQLIDGQQRLTSLSLLMCALRDVAAQHGEQKLADQIDEQYLTHKYETALRQFRVLPRLSDREPFRAAIEGKLLSEHEDFGVIKALRFFTQQIDEWASESPADRLKALFQAVSTRLSLVVITIDGENPYEIFESLNSTGLPLEEADLIRNYLFMQVDTADQEDFNDQYWSALEAVFGEGEQKRLNPTAFYRNYLMRDGKPCRKGMAFVDFKAINRERDIAPADQTCELLRFAKLESMIRRPDECSDPAVAAALREIGLLEITTSHPLLLKVLDRWQSGSMGTDELLGCLRDLASFVLRRSICGLSTRSYNRYFPEAAGSIQQDPRQDLQEYWLKRGWPSDAQFAEHLMNFPIYRREAKKLRLILERLEAEIGHKEVIDAQGLSIEHVMPQKIGGANGESWRKVLGEDYRALHEKWLHTLGNLTLTGYNPDMGNASFEKKRDSLKESHVEMNKTIAANTQWGVAQITERAGQLIEQVTTLWPAPAEAGVAVEEDPQTKPKASTNAERRSRYWTKLIAICEEAGLPVAPQAVTTATYLDFEMEPDLVQFGVRLFNRQSELWARTVFRRKAGRALFDYLLARRGDIDAGFETPPIWHDASPRRIYFKRSMSRVADVATWAEQQAWLRDRLRELDRVLSPHVDAFAAEITPDAVSTTGKAKREFWEELRERLLAQEIVGSTTKVYSAGFESNLGVRGCRIGSSLRLKKRCALIKLRLWPPHCDVNYAHLQQHRDEIQAALDVPLEWRPPGSEGKDGLLVGTIPVDVDCLDDGAKRAALLDWYAATFEGFKQVFVPLLEASPHAPRP